MSLLIYIQTSSVELARSATSWGRVRGRLSFATYRGVLRNCPSWRGGASAVNRSVYIITHSPKLTSLDGGALQNSARLGGDREQKYLPCKEFGNVNQERRGCGDEKGVAEWKGIGGGGRSNREWTQALFQNSRCRASSGCTSLARRACQDFAESLARLLWPRWKQAWQPLEPFDLQPGS